LEFVENLSREMVQNASKLEKKGKKSHSLKKRDFDYFLIIFPILPQTVVILV